MNLKLCNEKKSTSNLFIVNLMYNTEYREKI